MIALWLSAALATQPTHVRAVAEVPDSLAGLSGDRSVRVWWDDTGEPALVEVAVRGEWRVAARDAEPGLRLRGVPSAALVRVSIGEDTSEAVGVTRALGPAGLARLAAPEALSGREVSDISSDETGAWASLLEGGLVRLDHTNLQAAPWGMAEGLPSETVLSVTVAGDRVWVGTVRGLACVEQGRVTRVYTTEDGLPDDWVQSVAPVRGSDALWAGTYRGLARVDEAGVSTVLGPWSVFSVIAGPDERDWVGYEGLRGLPDGEPIEGVDSSLNVWDVDSFPPRLYLATDTEGVLLLQEGLLASYWTPASSAVYALHRMGGALYAASDTAGLIKLSDRDGAVDAWGRAEGLPSNTVYEVTGGPPSKLWVGTDRGVALFWPDQDVAVPWPVSPLAAGVGVGPVLGERRWALVGTDEGLVALGRLPRGWSDALALPGPIVGLCELDGDLWVVGEGEAWRVRRGQLERFELPGVAEHAVAVGGSLWVGGPEGLARFDGAQGRFVPGPVRAAITAMAAGQAGILWVGAGGNVNAVSPAGAVRTYSRTHRPAQLAVTAEGVWVGSPAGVEYLDPVSGEVQLAVDGPVKALAAAPDGEPVVILGDGSARRVRTGLPVTGLAPIESVGELRGATIDGAGRLWIAGELGGMVLAR